MTHEKKDDIFWLPIHRLSNPLWCLCHCDTKALTKYKQKKQNQERKIVCYLCCMFSFIILCFFAPFTDYTYVFTGFIKACVDFWVYVYILIMVSPVTMTVRMCALWRSCSTPADSAFSLFCMIIRPRNSMLASMWSLVQRKKKLIFSCVPRAEHLNITLLEGQPLLTRMNHWKDTWHDKR